MKNLIQPENAAEAKVLQALLAEHDIQSEVVSFHDTAYDGLFQAQYGWGVLRVSEADYEAALTIISEWRQGAPRDLPWQDRAESAEENET